MDWDRQIFLNFQTLRFVLTLLSAIAQTFRCLIFLSWKECQFVQTLILGEVIPRKIWLLRPSSVISKARQSVDRFSASLLRASGQGKLTSQIGQLRPIFIHKYFLGLQGLIYPFLPSKFLSVRLHSKVSVSPYWLVHKILWREQLKNTL